MPPARRLSAGTRWVLGAALVVVVVIVVVVIATSGSSAPTVGYDVSYPQCSGSYPSNALFGIVGVNGGLANNSNHCLSSQLSWARATPGQKHPPQPRVSLYINTGNPGGHHVADWPTGGTAPNYGACNGQLTNSCSYVYGEQRAMHSYGLVAAENRAEASSSPWWLDVELMATWAGTYKLNIAALQGFFGGLRKAGATGAIGIYSTAVQWKEITGLTAQTTTAAFGHRLPGWVAGIESTVKRAKQACVSGGFTGPRPTLAQYQLDHFDADLRCSSGSPAG